MNNSTVILNSIYHFKGIGFDPIRDKRTISIEKVSITHYTRRSVQPTYAKRVQPIVIHVSSDIEAFQNRNEEEIEKYISSNWKYFLEYALNGFYKEQLILYSGNYQDYEPIWNSLEEAQEALGDKNKELISISPYS